MAISARPSTMSLGAAACVVMLLFAQAVLEVNAMRPMLAPTSAPVYAPESAPMYAPEIAPVWSPEYAPEMAPMAPPAYAPEISPLGAPITYGPASSEMVPGPSPMQSGAGRNVASSAGVLLVGLAAFLLY